MYNDEDTKNLIGEIKKDDKLQKYKKAISKHRIIILIFSLFIFFQFIFLSVQYNQNKFYRYQYKLSYSSIHNVEQEIMKRNRKQKTIYMIMRVALKYNLNFNEKKLANVAELIYNIGEIKYDIPVEEWIVLITHESRWNPKAVSQKGAIGLMQIMPLTGQYAANILGIVWHGRATLFDIKNNIRIGMRIYYDLTKVFVGKPEYYISAYNWWIPSIKKFSVKNKKLSGKYEKYFKKYLKIGKDVERIINKKIDIVEGIYK